MSHSNAGMQNAGQRPSRGMFWLAALALPPAGIVLLWMRRGPRAATKLAGTLLLAVLTVVYATFILVRFFDMRVEMAGGGMPTIISFGKPGDHYARVEQARAAEPAVPAAEPAAAEAAPPPSSPGAPAAQPAPERAAAPARGSTYWSDFRGPGRTGHYDQTPILTAWPRGGLRELWRQPVGGGYASLAIAEGRAFTIEQRRDGETVAAYDLATGRELWTDRWEAHFQETMGGDGPRATPVWDQGRVYALGASGELRCLEAATGRVVWRKNILEENGAPNLVWGMAASPLVAGDLLITLPGGPGGRSVVAYNKHTGEPVWAALDDKQAYVSPMLVTLAGRRQLLVVSATRVMGLSVEDGALLWDFPWQTSYDINAAQPIVVDGEHVFYSSGYGRGAVLLRIAGAEGGFRAARVWENVNLKTRFNAAVLHDGYIYGLDEGILACIEARTGARQWKGGRYGYGQVLLAGGHLVVLTERGEVVLVRATPERHDEVASFPAISGKTWNHPAISEGVLVVRNAREMAAFRLAP